MTDLSHPAFPYHFINNLGGQERHKGMSLRDYFAGQALIGLCSAATVGDSTGGIAEQCFMFADAMLTEREKK